MKLAMQCPGCWSVSYNETDGTRTWECECGEKLTVIDLRDKGPGTASLTTDRGQLERPRQRHPVQEEGADGAGRERELLVQAQRAIEETAEVLLTVAPTLQQPYPDDDRWSPWTRWIDRNEDSPLTLLDAALTALNEYFAAPQPEQEKEPGGDGEKPVPEINSDGLTRMILEALELPCDDPENPSAQMAIKSTIDAWLATTCAGCKRRIGSPPPESWREEEVPGSGGGYVQFRCPACQTGGEDA